MCRNRWPRGLARGAWILLNCQANELLVRIPPATVNFFPFLVWKREKNTAQDLARIVLRENYFLSTKEKVCPYLITYNFCRRKLYYNEFVKFTLFYTPTHVLHLVWQKGRKRKDYQEWQFRIFLFFSFGKNKRKKECATSCLMEKDSN